MTARQKIWDFLFKNSTSLYVFTFCIIISALLLFVQEIKHTSQMIKSHTHILLITEGYEREIANSKEKDKFILVILVDPELLKDKKTKSVKEATIQFTFFDYKEYKMKKESS